MLTSAAIAAALYGSTVPGRAQSATTIRYPDLQTIIPASGLSIAQTSTGRFLYYTHDIYDAGTGPLEIQPVYSATSGNYQGLQHIYAQDASGNWTLAQTVPIAGVFEFDPDHGHFHFPMASFGLYTVTPDGGIGTPVSISAKDGFCIADSYIFDPTLLNAGAFGYEGGTCADPTAVRGISVGGVDEYDFTDPGQAIAIDNVPDGTYWLRSIVDPFNYLVESDKSNNETDVEIAIANNTVQVLQTIHPDSTPPTVTMTSPAAAGAVHGTITLAASAPDAGAVQFLLDGQPLGAIASNSPYTFSLDTTTVSDGQHWLAAQATSPAGYIGTSSVVGVMIANHSPAGPLSLDRAFSQAAIGSVSQAVSTSFDGEVLLAFVAADGPPGAPQSATVSSAGLTWNLVKRGNTQDGDAEIWTATASTALSGTVVTSTLTSPGYSQSLTVLTFTGAGGVGASAASAAVNGAPRVQLTTTAAGSWIFGVGNDWDAAVPRTAAAGQTLINQSFAPAGDTFWIQSQSNFSASAGQQTAIADMVPTTDQWNLAAVELLPASAPPPDTTPPTVAVTSPADGSTVSAAIQLAATASDDTVVTSVQFYVDGMPLGPPITSAPYMTNWDTSATSNGVHTLTASATDAAGLVGTSTPVSVAVSNTAAPLNPIGVDATINVDGSGEMTSPGFSTSAPGDLLVAFVAYDGPDTSPQTATVSGAGLSWSLVKRSNTQAGDAEIWVAQATDVLSNVTVTATPGTGEYHGSLVVVAFTNASGVGVSGIAGAPTGEPDIYLPGISAGNLVFAVGHDWDNAIDRTPVSGQVLVHERVDTTVNDTFWVQAIGASAAVSGAVDVHDSAPTGDRWNFAAVEIKHQ